MDKIFFEAVLIGMMGWIVLPAFRSKDKSLIWNPLTFVCIYLTYYVLVPVINQRRVMGYDWSEESVGLLIAACISLLCIIIGYKLPVPRNFFRHTNKTLEGMNKTRTGIALCAIAFICYGVIKGFSLNLFQTAEIVRSFDSEASYNNPKAYVEYLVSLFCIGCPIMLIVAKEKKRGRLYFGAVLTVALIVYAISGFRYRILILCATLMTTIYLFPRPKRMNYLVVGSVAVVIFLGMAIIERTRTYGHGLDISKIENQSLTTMEAGESDYVSSFSALIIEKYNSSDLLYFEPIITAATMPIPRAIFPDKPKGYYTREANLRIYGTIAYGNAFIYFAEAYMSFGWLGIMIQGLFIGWVCNIFWNNYILHNRSLGAVILLGLFNGFCFVWVSRGYLAQVFTTYMYFLIIPFWVIRLLNRFRYFRTNN